MLAKRKVIQDTEFLFNFTVADSAIVNFHCLLFSCGCNFSSYLHPLPIKQGEADVGLARSSHLASGTPFYSKDATPSGSDAGPIVIEKSASHCPLTLSCELSASISCVLTPEGDTESKGSTTDVYYGNKMCIPTSQLN